MNLNFEFGLYCDFELVFFPFRVRLDGGVEKWEDGKLWEDGKYLVFPLVCLVGGVEKWEGGKLFCLVGEKNEMMKNVIYIDLFVFIT